MEYERRFRLSKLPEEVFGPEVLIRQVYWSLGDEWVLRLRRTGNEIDLDDEIAIKGPRRSSGRPELEFRLGAAKKSPSLSELARVASDLYLAGGGNQVVKTRHSFLDAYGNAWDIDVFHLENDGLIIAELEMDAPLALYGATLPDWAKKEISDDRRYNNERLAFRPFSTWRDDE